MIEYQIHTPTSTFSWCQNINSINIFGAGVRGSAEGRQPQRVGRAGGGGGP